MKTQMLDLYSEHLSIKKEISRAIHEVIKSGDFIGGEFVDKFEKEFASYCGTKYAVALNSGTDALYLSLWSLGIEKGDEVITTPFTFIATTTPIILRGAKPVFVDINPQTFNIDADKIEEKITKHTKAIIPVHLFGYPSDMYKITALAKKYKLDVIEDACQAIGAKYKNKKVGGLGTTACFSFYPTKNLGTYGDGGMVITNNKSLANKIKLLRNHGSTNKYQYRTLGINSRLDCLQASILAVKLKYLDKWNSKRRQIANEYNKGLQDIAFIQTPFEDQNAYHVYNQYTLRIKHGLRDELQKYLSSHNIPSMIYYPTPLHLLKIMKSLEYKKGDFLFAENASQEVLSLPIYPKLSQKEIKYILHLIKSFQRKYLQQFSI